MTTHGMPSAIGLVASILTSGACGAAPSPPNGRAAIDQDLFDVTVPGLHRYYVEQKYTVTQVVEWHLERIDRYNGIYGAIEHVFRDEARARAAELDTQGAAGKTDHGPLWGVPIVIKANTSINDHVTTNGWEGFTIPGHELIAPQDATIVAKLRGAGAIILGHTNMPDFASSDTNRSSSFGRTGNAYDVRVSPGGSSGGTVTAVAANMAVLGTGTDTGNSIRMPAATSALVGVLPTRGLVSTAGIAPLDWLLDNTGPIARTVGDGAIALSVMAGEDRLDARTEGSAAQAQPGPYDRYLNRDALKGKRFGVPRFILDGEGIPFRGIPAPVPEASVQQARREAATPLAPETRVAFETALGKLRDAGATVVMDDTILGVSFAELASRVATYPYVRQGTEQFLMHFGPVQYRSSEEYATAVGRQLGTAMIGRADAYKRFGRAIGQRALDSDPDAERNYHGPRRETLAAYLEPLDRLMLDGYVYPAIQMPPPDETMPQDGALSSGPHSATSWVNMIGVPAIVVAGGFYASGLPFGLEFSARPWKDGDLLGYAYAWEQATRERRPPVLVDKGLLPNVPRNPRPVPGR
jgi:Asp-tRNA(Asn)/Glu-tRNA(Gln) amidotransferase A subunit family amidase